MKKIAMIAAGLMISGAGIAQTGGITEASWENEAVNGYPPCSATVTDSCVQLYERGIDTGSMAMGGPYEPVETHSDSMIDHDMAGVGGPIEERTGYPPCDPGPGDDRCIQLYEPGVSGSGN